MSLFRADADKDPFELLRLPEAELRQFAADVLEHYRSVVPIRDRHFHRRVNAVLARLRPEIRRFADAFIAAGLPYMVSIGYGAPFTCGPADCSLAPIGGPPDMLILLGAPTDFGRALLAEMKGSEDRIAFVPLDRSVFPAPYEDCGLK